MFAEIMVPTCLAVPAAGDEDPGSAGRCPPTHNLHHPGVLRGRVRTDYIALF